MTYAATIEYLYSRLPMFSRIGEAAIKKDLTNTWALCEYLGNPQHSFKSIHIAGTNGKGSTSHMLAAALQSCGYRTGLYTSPHLYDFRERIKVNGEMIRAPFVVSFVERIRPAIERLDPSFFEVTVAMAFSYLAEMQVDIAVIETGLGGRLDSTNVIRPEIALITNIGMDHMNLLGDTLPQIAGEKAGIIKPGIPVVVGERQAETDPVFRAKAQEANAPLHFAADYFQPQSVRNEGDSLHIEMRDLHSQKLWKFGLDLTGHYQAKNLATVLTGIHLLRQNNWDLDDQCVTKGINQTRLRTGLHGRWELIRKDPRVVIDVAHNVDGIRQVLDQLRNSAYRNLHWIIGVVKDKDYDSMLRLLPVQATYYFTRSQIPRALDEAELAARAQSIGLSGNSYPNVNLALEAALQKASPDDLVLICGSIFIAAEVTRSESGSIRHDP